MLIRTLFTIWHPPEPAQGDPPVDPTRVQYIQLHRHGNRPLYVANFYAHPSNLQARNTIIQQTALTLRRTGEDLVILGDFNCTPDEEAVANLPTATATSTTGTPPATQDPAAWTTPCWAPTPTQPTSSKPQGLATTTSWSTTSLPALPHPSTADQPYAHLK